MKLEQEEIEEQDSTHKLKENLIHLSYCEHSVMFPYVLLREFQAHLKDSENRAAHIAHLKEVMPVVAENLVFLDKEISRLKEELADQLSLTRGLEDSLKVVKEEREDLREEIKKRDRQDDAILGWMREQKECLEKWGFASSINILHEFSEKFKEIRGVEDES